MEENRNTNAFNTVKDQIGFCGIWCGSCIVGNETLRELTRRYKDLINKHGLKHWGPKDFDFDEFYKGLESIENMPLCAGCLKGGGRDDCEIKACTKEKNLQDCTLCGQFGQCDIKLLEDMRSGALKAGLMVLNQDDDRAEVLEKWTQELKSKWPCCILFAKEK